MPELTERSEGALRAVERDWNAAAQNWNSAGLVALYTEDAVFYGGRPGHAVGHAKVREYFDSYVGTLAAARLALVDQELRKLAEGVYLAQGYARSTLTYCRRRHTRCTTLDIGSDASSRRLADRPASFFVATGRTTYSASTSGTELKRYKIS